MKITIPKKTRRNGLVLILSVLEIHLSHHSESENNSVNERNSIRETVVSTPPISNGNKLWILEDVALDTIVVNISEHISI